MTGDYRELRAKMSPESIARGAQKSRELTKGMDKADLFDEMLALVERLAKDQDGGRYHDEAVDLLERANSNAG